MSLVFISPPWTHAKFAYLLCCFFQGHVDVPVLLIGWPYAHRHVQWNIPSELLPPHEVRVVHALEEVTRVVHKTRQLHHVFCVIL